jgi:dihydrofolate synthase/folylpolyglutamate synthase
MKDINNFKDIDKYLRRFKHTLSTQPYNLKRMKHLMKFLGNPQKNLNIIHVAGTSGKTSTCYYVASLLKQAGYTTGLSVSPHIDEINERLQINLNPLKISEFIDVFNDFCKIIETFDQNITYFEFFIALAFWYFNKIKVDYAIIEVGIGGLLDGTNIADNSNKICVITDIGIDHTKLLGDSIELIAKQKAGIIKKYNQVFCHNQNSVVDNIIKNEANKFEATLHHPKHYEYILNLNEYQKRNFLLACSVVDYIIEKDIKHSLNIEQIKNASNIIIPGRFEVIKLKNKTIILDGAHNPQKINSLVENVLKIYPNKSTRILIALRSSDKQKNKEILLSLIKLTNKITVTQLSPINNQELEEKYEIFKKILDSQDVNYLGDPDKALTKSIDSSENILIITGSFYLVGKYRKTLIQGLNQ